MLLLQVMWHLLGLLWDEPYTGDLEMTFECTGHQSVGADVSALVPLTSSSQLNDRTAGSNAHFCTGPANQIVLPIHLNCQYFYECHKGRKSLHQFIRFCKNRLIIFILSVRPYTLHVLQNTLLVQFRRSL